MSNCASLKIKKNKKNEIWAADSQENHWNYCYQMSDIKAKMYQNRLQRYPDPLAKIIGTYF